MLREEWETSTNGQSKTLLYRTAVRLAEADSGCLAHVVAETRRERSGIVGVNLRVM